MNSRALKENMRMISYKLPSTRDLRIAMSSRPWMVKVEIESAYFHMSIHPSLCCYLGFYWKMKFLYILQFFSYLCLNLRIKAVAAVLMPGNQGAISVLGTLQSASTHSMVCMTQQTISNILNVRRSMIW